MSRPIGIALLSLIAVACSRDSESGGVHNFLKLGQALEGYRLDTEAHAAYRARSALDLLDSRLMLRHASRHWAMGARKEAKSGFYASTAS